MGIKRVRKKIDYAPSLEEQEVLALLEKFFDGLAEENLEILDRIIDPDGKILALGSRAPLKKSEYLARVASRNPSINRKNFRYTNVVVEVYDDWAMARGLFFMSNAPEKIIPLNIRFKKRANEWLISDNTFFN